MKDYKLLVFSRQNFELYEINAQGTSAEEVKNNWEHIYFNYACDASELDDWESPQEFIEEDEAHFVAAFLDNQDYSIGTL